MTSEEWSSSDDAREMLATLHHEQPAFFLSQLHQIHQFLIACCWKHQHLIPQEGLRNGLRGAEDWLAGKIDDDELNRLNWYAEAEAFSIDYAKSPDEISEIKSLVNGIDALSALSFEDARKQILDAAYFAEGAMAYPLMSKAPWVDRLLTSEFLCPDLLRQFIKPSFLT